MAGQAKRALLEALKPAVNGQDQAEPMAFKGASAVAGASTVAGATAVAGAAATKQSLQLFLHPRDVRMLSLKALPLSGRERMTAIRSQLEGSLLEDIDQLVVAFQFDSSHWFAGFCQKHWLEALVYEAKALGLKLEGIWPAQCINGGHQSARSGELAPIAEGNNAELNWPPRPSPSHQTLVAPKNFNLLEALVMQSQHESWAGMNNDSSGMLRRLMLGFAQLRWAMGHAPKGALQRPLAVGAALIATAGIALQIDTWILQSRVEATENELTRLFKETMPNQTVMVDPVLQLQRALDRRRLSPSPGSLGSDSAVQIDPLAGMLLMQKALSRAGGASAAEAVQMIEWTAGPSGGLLSLRWKPSAIEQQNLRPLIQDLAIKGGWTVQWGTPQEGLMQWRANARAANAS